MTRIPPDIEIRIGRLVLDGIPPAERAAVRAALERELAALYSSSAATLATARPGTTRLPGGSLTVGAGLAAEEMGARAARAVWDSLQEIAGSRPGRTGGTERS